jgi:hypothetical protein
MNRGQLAKLIIVGSITMLFLSLSGCVDNNSENGNGNGGPKDDWQKWPKFQSSIELRSGYSTEFSEEIERFNLYEKYITKIFIELTWEDEPSNYMGGTNEPDTFNITIITSQQKEIYSDITGNPLGGEGKIRETIVVPEYEIANNTAVGEWTVKIFCQSCGEDTSNAPIPRISEDPGNSWEIKYYYEYHSQS